jgi:hypothetical protein
MGSLFQTDALQILRVVSRKDMGKCQNKTNHMIDEIQMSL